MVISRIDCLMHEGEGYRFKGIVDCIDNKNLNSEEIAALQNLTSDSFMIAGRTISCYATAALDILGIKKYIGKDENIHKLISELNNY